MQEKAEQIKNSLLEEMNSINKIQDLVELKLSR